MILRTLSIMRLWLFVLAALMLVGSVAWLSDRVTLQGERTIYTVDCHDGAWQELHCTGRLVAAERFRFRALKPHREVVFWTVGATEPSGKLTDCDIEDGRNWVCRPTADATRTITLKMSNGVPVRDSIGLVKPYHAIAKWRWLILHWGVPIGSSADD
jgi:hypothetical protein